MAAGLGFLAEAPEDNQFWREQFVALGGGEQLRMHRHRLGNPHQTQLVDTVRVPCSRLQCHERAHGMTDQRCRANTAGVHKSDYPISHFLYSHQRLTFRLAVTGQINGQRAARTVRGAAAARWGGRVRCREPAPPQGHPSWLHGCR